MNRQIVKLFGLIVILFAVLIGFTSYWAVFDAQALKDKEANKRPLLEQQHDQHEQLRDLRVHGERVGSRGRSASRRARSEISSSSASRTKLATIELPP